MSGIIQVIKLQQPDDKYQSILPKIQIVLSIYIVIGTISLVPFDRATRYINMHTDILWTISIISTIQFSILIIPFAFFYYETASSDDIPILPTGEDNNINTKKSTKKQLQKALLYTSIFLFILSILSIILYVTPANTATIDIQRIRQDILNSTPLCDTNNTFKNFTNYDLGSCIGNGCSMLGIKKSIDMNLSYLVYFIAQLSFLGWFALFTFAGCGLVSLPIDLINTFRKRPIPITNNAFIEESKNISKRANDLLDNCLELRDNDINKLNDNDKDKEQRLYNIKNTRGIEREYFLLMEDWERLKLSRNFRESNPLWYILSLFFGIIGSIISFLWLLHICLFILPKKPISNFLNHVFIVLSDLSDGRFPLFGILAYSIFCIYLLWCVLWGMYRLGLDFLLFKIYPLKVHDTPISGLLLNVWILLLSVYPMIQLIYDSFPIYAQNTYIEAIFGSQIRKLRGFKYIWDHNIFIYILLAIACLYLIITVLFPKNKKKEVEKYHDDLIRRNRRLHRV